MNYILITKVRMTKSKEIKEASNKPLKCLHMTALCFFGVFPFKKELAHAQKGN